MVPSSLHMLAFSLRNPYTLTSNRDGPFPALYRLLTVRTPSVSTLDLSEFSDCNILITGATSGCGLELALALAHVGCHLILTSRDLERGKHVRQRVLDEAKRSKAATSVDILELDMTCFNSITSAMSRVQELVSHLDIVVLNAGVYQTDFRICPGNNWEETTQVNVLATLALSLLLRNHLARSGRGKLLIVSSEAHAWADPHHSTTRTLLNEMSRSDSKLYPCYQRYHISKLLNVLWIREISCREEWRGIDVAAVSPGFTRSGLFRTFNDKVIARVLERAICRSAAQGATQYVYALQQVTSEQRNGGFWSDGRWRRLVLQPVIVTGQTDMLNRPCTAVTCENGRQLQKSVYVDVVHILQGSNAIGKGNLEKHSA